MSESIDKESSDKAQSSAPCPRCHKPFAKALKFTVSSWFQTDPGDGLSRWQDCCKCGIERDRSEDELAFVPADVNEEVEVEPVTPPSVLHDSVEIYPAEHTETETEANTNQASEFAEQASHGKSDAIEDEPGAPVEGASEIAPDSLILLQPEITGQSEPAAEHQQESKHAIKVETRNEAEAEAEVEVDAEAEAEPAFKVKQEQEPELGSQPNLPKPQPQSKPKPEQWSKAHAKEQPDHSDDDPTEPTTTSTIDGDSASKSSANKTGDPETTAGSGKPKFDVAVPHSPMTPAARSAVSAPPVTPPASQSYMIGGRYEVDSVIGKGTFGPTYKARDVATGKFLCLKMVSTPISRLRRVVKRILQEIEKSKTLNHPHIVAIYDSGIDKSGRPFYVMDLVDRGSLKNAIRQEGFLDVPEVIDIFLDVCEALGYAHEHGMLHRDLKPSNILLTGELTTRRAKVCDFGIIKAIPSVGSEALEMTQSTDVFADPSCMSPEQCLGRRVDVRSDIYSLGCSMYEAIIGKKVFTGPNPLSIVVQHFKSAPKTFDSVMYNCDISQDVEAVVMRMLEKSPEHRYQEISQVVEDLRLLKAHKKPTYAYQKKKGPRPPLLGFGAKPEEDSAEKLFDVVLLKKNFWNEKNNPERDPRHQIAADIDKLALQNNQNQRRNKKDPAPREQDNQPSGDEIWARESKKPRDHRADVILPGKLILPQDNEPPLSREAANYRLQEPPSGAMVGRPARIGRNNENEARDAQLVQRKLLPVYRASDSYPANAISLFCTSDEEDEENAQSIVTVEQAKREIPDYLLQVSRSTGTPFGTLPMTVALITAVTMIVLFLQLVVSSR